MAIRLESTRDPSVAVTLPLSFAVKSIGTSYALARASLPGGRPPVRTRGRAVNAPTLQVAGTLFDSAANYADTRDTLRAVAAEPELKLWRDYSLGRYMLVEPSGLTESPTMLPREAELALELTALEDTERGNNVTTTGQTASGLSLPIAVGLGGTAPTRPRVTITCRAGADFFDPALELDTGERVVITGTYTNGDLIVFDADALRVTVNGASAADRLTDSSTLVDFAMRPGSRTLTVAAGGSVLDVSVGIVYPWRWY